MGSKFLVADHIVASQGRRSSSVSKSTSRMGLSTKTAVLIEEIGNVCPFRVIVMRLRY